MQGSYMIVLAIGMLFAGSLNTIAYKLADWQSADGVYSPRQCNWTAPEQLAPPPDVPCPFVHPFFQVLAMFLGECICLLAHAVLRFFGAVEPSPSFNPFVFLPCALCDMCGTSLMLLGLLLTFASNYQMLRGSVVLFTGILSRLLLGRILNKAHWSGLLLILLGTAVVGVQSWLESRSSSATLSTAPLGNALIVGAQVIVAVQFVLEEKFVSGLDVPPLLAVGLEGVFGFLMLSGVLVGMYFLPGVAGLSETPLRLEDTWDALRQLTSGGNVVLPVAMLAAVLSIAVYNFFGISVTKHLSAAHRMVLDSTRTVIVWGFALIIHAASPHSGHGQGFSWLQLVGFVILVAGSIVYYELLPVCRPARKGSSTGGDDPLLVVSS